MLLFMLFLDSALFLYLFSFIFFSFFFSHSKLFNFCASNHFGLRLETGETQFVMADCAVLLAHAETWMGTLVSAVGWLCVDFTHRSLTITEGFFLPGKCCKYSPDSILLVPLSALPVPFADLGVIHSCVHVKLTFGGGEKNKKFYLLSPILYGCQFKR